MNQINQALPPNSRVLKRGAVGQVALGDANLAQAIDFGTKETACETVWIMKNISKNQRNQVVNSLKPKVYEQGEATPMES